MKWLPTFRRRSHSDQVAARFPHRVGLNDPSVHATIYSHELATARGTISCWSYVTSGLASWGQKEIVLTLKRERDESPGSYPKEPLEYFSVVVPYAREGQWVGAGAVSQFGHQGGLFGGHVMYVEAEPLAGVEVPPDSLAAILITNQERETVKTHGAMRVMARLGREAAHFPCPPWNDRTRLRSERPIADESVLKSLPSVSAPGVSVGFKGRDVVIDADDSGRDTLRRVITQWSPDEPLAILTGLGDCDGCMVWEPGMTGLNAITPPHSQATRLAACFVIISGGRASNEMHVVEDGIGLLLTTEAAASLYDALIHGRELRLFTHDGATIVAESGDQLPDLTIMMLYPESEWIVRGTDPLTLSLYIKDLWREIHRASVGDEPLDTCDVFVALRGRRSRIWNAPPALRERLERIQPPATEPGPFAFVLRLGHDPQQPVDSSLNYPGEWHVAGGTIDDAIANAWPSTTVSGHSRLER